MSEAEHFLQDARKSFRLAAAAVGLKKIERYSAMGRDYLQIKREGHLTESWAGPVIAG